MQNEQLVVRSLESDYLRVSLMQFCYVVICALCEISENILRNLSVRINFKTCGMFYIHA